MKKQKTHNSFRKILRIFQFYFFLKKHQHSLEMCRIKSKSREQHKRDGETAITRT